MTIHSPVCGALCTAVLLAAPLAARADIANFGNFAGFTVNLNDFQPAPTYALNTINITKAADHGNEARSVFYNAPQTITGFTAKFSYVCQNSNIFMGAAFVLENSPAGANAVGGNGALLGYEGGTMTGKSAAFTLEGSASGGNVPFSSGFYINGQLRPNSPSTAPVALQLGHQITATISYDGSFLHENLLDTVSLATYDVTYLEDLPGILGGNSAYFGLTVSNNGGGGGQDQTFSNFSFTATTVPEPASLGIVGIGATGLLARRRRR